MHPYVRFLLTLLLLSTFTICRAQSVVKHYVEDFTTTTYKDTLNTTARWDTVAGELGLFEFEPHLVGGNGNSALGVWVEGDVAYLAARSLGLQMADVSDPSSPSLLGMYPTPGWVWDVVVDGQLAFLATGSQGLFIVDVSDPTSPSFVGTFDPAPSGSSEAVAVDGDHIYLADGSNGLWIVDVTNPSLPSSVSWLPTASSINGVFVNGNVAHVVDDWGLIVVDVTDPATPTQIGSYTIGPGGAIDVVVSGDYAYLISSTGGLFVIDVSVPSTPSFVASDLTIGGQGVDVSGDLCFVAALGDGVKIVDISNPAAPTVRDTIDTPSAADKVFFDGDHIFVGDTAAGLQIIDMMSTATMNVVGSYETPPASLGEVVVDGDHAFATSSDGGFYAFDITDPADPQLVGSYPTSDALYTLVVRGDYAYVAGLDSTRIIDISDPTAPHLSARRQGAHARHDVAGDYLYVSASDGFYVFDVSDPTSIVYVTRNAAIPTYGGDIDVVGNYAYTIDPVNGLYVVDISDPTNPTTAGTLLTYGVDIAVSGRYLYVAKEGAGIEVVDVADPTNPTSVTTLGGFTARDVVASGDHCYVLNLAWLVVVDISDPSNPALVLTTPIGGWDIAVQGRLAILARSSDGLASVLVRQEHFEGRSNTARSLEIDQRDDYFVDVRFSTTQNDSVKWEFSSIGGGSWSSITSDGTWHPTSGTQLMWRSTHFTPWHQLDVDPSCSRLEIDWLYQFAVIDSVVDVPNDQGGWVRLFLARSGWDREEFGLIVLYNVWRRVDNPFTVAAVAERGVACCSDLPVRLKDVAQGGPLKDEINRFAEATPGLLEWDGRVFLDPRQAAASGFPPGLWEIIGSFAPIQQDQYVFLSPSLGDSTASGITHTAFVITAHQSTPTNWYASPPDSGYSVDNIAPGVPENFAVAYNTGSGNTLSWDPAPEPDFQYFCVYRGESENFEPIAGNLVHLTIDTNWLDSVEEGWRYYYKITAVDHAGNESDPSSPGTVSAIAEPIVPKRFALYPSVPNPFNPVTVIPYDVPAGGGKVTIRIFNVSGQLVRTLVDRRETVGRKTVSWDGRSDRGEHVATGVYFYRMQAPGFEKTMKITLLK